MYKEILYEIIDKAIMEDTVTPEQYMKINEKLSRMNDFSCWKIVREHSTSNEAFSIISEDKYVSTLRSVLKARGVPKEKIEQIIASRVKMLKAKGALAKSVS